MSQELISKAASILGRIGGKSKSEAKKAASRQNAKLGGWPKNRKRGPKSPKPERELIVDPDFSQE